MTCDDDRKPVATVAELETLDERDIISGYHAGLNGREEPGVEFNRSYWHGWRNGMMDRGRMPHDAASSRLVSEAVDSGYLRATSLKAGTDSSPVSEPDKT